MKSLIKFLKRLLGLNNKSTHVKRTTHVPHPVIESEQPGDKFLRKAQVATRTANEPMNPVEGAAGIYGGSIPLEEVDDYLSKYSNVEFRKLAEEYLLLDARTRQVLVFDVREGNLSEKQSFIVVRTGGLPIPQAIFDQVAEEAQREVVAPAVPAVGGVVHGDKPTLVPIEPTKVDELEDDAPEIDAEDAEVIDATQPQPELVEEKPRLTIAEQMSFRTPEPEIDPVIKAEADRYMGDGRYTLVKRLNVDDGIVYVRPATSETLQWIPAHYFPNTLVRGLETLEHYEERVRIRKLGKRRLSGRERKRLTQAAK